MKVYRQSKAKFSNDLSGKGAVQSGGRWNSKGVAVAYASGSRALCTTEIAVHIPLGNIPTNS
jgi:RES domain-containing protein